MLRDITVGRYMDTGSALHGADAVTKILSAAAYSAAVFIADSFSGMALVFAFTAFAALSAKIPPRLLLKGLKPLRFFVVFTFVAALFSGGGDALWQWHALSITADGIRRAAILSLRFILFVGGTSLLTLTTPPMALTDGLARLLRPLSALKVPADDIAMIISVTLRFIPTLADESERIMKAQRARGADFSSGGLISRARALIPVAIPLFAGVFRRADELALAMDARCFGKGARTPRKRARFGKIDALTVIFTALLCVFLGIIEFLH